MFTSRAEHRLALRHDNADRRLTPLGIELGLVEEKRRERFLQKSAEIVSAIATASSKRFRGATLLEMLKRSETQWSDLVAIEPALASVSSEVAEQISNDVRYEGYLQHERRQIDRRGKLGKRVIPVGFDYCSVQHLRAEAKEKLSRIQPRTLEQAGRVSGVTPADLALVLIHLEGLASL